MQDTNLEAAAAGSPPLEHAPTTGSAHEPATQRTTFWRSPRVQLLSCLVLAIIIRLIVLLRSHGMMEGDEAVLGIQAERILHGSLPLYFQGQAYMASWDAYLAAPL